jgi:hypothetical protein
MSYATINAQLTSIGEETKILSVSADFVFSLSVHNSFVRGNPSDIS